ncbi:MAG TPA: UDP-glucose/GDP-mannose dehydrogenase family protein [Candidatus Omnitrophota bacterium]|nr:UDP-glucose/GDP-mannose dehydrogenase family protein [Candidatus Omnitrophota bacterium]
MKIGVIGSGHVGLVTGACFADLGHEVLCVDQDVRKIALLKKGKMPFFEPGLSELVRKNQAKKRLVFSTRIRDAVREAEVLFIAVGTPTKESGEADLSSVEAVVTEIAKCLRRYCLIVEKSTVPVETGNWVKRTISINMKGKNKTDFDVASNPEFLREGAAIEDFMRPDRIVLGVESKRAEKILRTLYEPLNAPIVVTDINSAEIIKHASNSFLASKISFINMVSRLCEKVGADVKKVAEGMGYDSRIGTHFLDAGVGFGGSCFPKDLAAFVHIGEKAGADFSLLRSVIAINAGQRIHYVQKVKEVLWNLSGKRIGVLGLSFKPDTDDMRAAPSIDVIRALQGEGSDIRAFDPEAIPAARSFFRGVTYVKTPYEAARGADALLFLTEWKEFKELDFSKLKRLMKRPLVFDGRNMFDPKQMKGFGFEYVSVGRQTVNRS